MWLAKAPSPTNPARASEVAWIFMLAVPTTNIFSRSEYFPVVVTQKRTDSASSGQSGHSLTTPDDGVQLCPKVNGKQQP